MGLTYKNNAPVKFITGTYLGYDAENDRCNCFTRPFCQLVERLDTTDYQVTTTANTSNLVTAGDFSTACGVDWACGADWLIAAGVATKVPGAAGQVLNQPICIISQRRYSVQFDVTAITVGTLSVFLGGILAGTVVFGIAGAVGTHTFFVDPSVMTDVLIEFRDIAGTLNVTIDNVIINELSQIGYEIETQTGTSIFTDVAPGTPTYFETTGQITVDWTQASTDDCYVICNHDSSDYREQICNGDFAIDALWTIFGGWTIAAGVATVITGAPFSALMTQTLVHPLLAGRCYTITFDVSNFVQGSLQVFLVDLNIVVCTVTGNGAKTCTIDLTALGAETQIQFRNLNAISLDIDNVSVTMDTVCFEEDACSECYKLADTWDCSFLFSWTNDENAFGFEYVGLSFTQFFRHIVKLWQPVYPENADRFLDSAGSDQVLFAISQKVEQLTLQEMPEYLHDAFRLAVIHDTFTIETVNYTKDEGDYEPSWRKSSLLAPVELQVRENGQDNVNENCV